MCNVLDEGDAMTQTPDGNWEHNGWVITIWQGKREGVWEYRASRGKDHKHDFVQAWSEESAAEMVALELAE